MAKLTDLERLHRASAEELSKAQAGKLADSLQELIATLQDGADALQEYADAEGAETAETREAAAASAGEVLSDLRALGVGTDADDEAAAVTA